MIPGVGRRPSPPHADDGLAAPLDDDIAQGLLRSLTSGRKKHPEFDRERQAQPDVVTTSNRHLVPVEYGEESPKKIRRHRSIRADESWGYP